MVTFFFPKCNKPSMTLEKGLRYYGSVLDSKGDLHHLELVANGLDEFDCTSIEVKDFKSFATSFMLDSDCRLSSTVCFDSVPVEFGYALARQRSGIKLTVLKEFHATFNLLGIKNITSLFCTLNVYRDRIELEFYTK